MKSQVKNKIEQSILRILNYRNEQTNLSELKKSLLTKTEEFLDEYVYPIIFDDFIFSKEDQPKLFDRIRSLIFELETLLSFPWLYGKTKVAFAGKFSSGKSSVINTLLKENTLPTDVTPTTAIPTYITFTSKYASKVLVINKEGAVIPFEKSFLSLLRHDNISEFYGSIFQSIIDYIVLNTNHSLLKDAVIIDTPGYNPASTKIDRELSVRVLKRSDVIFWTIDINDGDISNDAINLIKNNELDRKVFYVILNKADSKPPSARKKIASKVGKTLKRQGVNFKDILLFSSKEENSQYIRSITSTISKHKSRNSDISLFLELNEFLEGLLDMILEQQKDVIEHKNEMEKQIIALLKEVGSKLGTNIRLIIEEIFYEYAYYEVPWFDDTYYKLYKGSSLNGFLRDVTVAIKDLMLDNYKELLINYKGDFQNIRQNIDHYEKQIDNIRKAIAELEKVKIFACDRLRNFMGGRSNYADRE